MTNLERALLRQGLRLRHVTLTDDGGGAEPDYTVQHAGAETRDDRWVILDAHDRPVHTGTLRECEAYLERLDD